MSDKPVSDERKAEGFEPVAAVVARILAKLREPKK